MFEISIICVILLAISYWAVLWVMGRREDVLHGQFVDVGAEPVEEKPRAVFPDRSVRPVFPDRAAIKPKPAVLEPAGAMATPVPTMPKPAPAATVPSAPTPINEIAVRAAVKEPPAFRPERLESLLNTIKQDLNQLVQK